MAIDICEVGDTPTLTASFDVGGVPADPTTIAFSITQPDGTVTPYSYPATITRAGTGVYTVAWSVAQVGNHQYQFHGAAAGYGRTITRTFLARPTAFT